MNKLLSALPPALQHRKFALLWGGLLVSITGSQMQMAALLWHLRTLSDQPVVVSGIGLVRFLPILLLAPFAGVIADTHNRRHIMFITQTVMAGTAAMLGYLTWTGAIQIWHIYLLSGLQAAAISFDLPARQSLVPNLVPRNILPSAYSLQSIASSVGSILGPALSGVVIGHLGQFAVYWMNTASFMAVLLALLLMGTVEQGLRPALAGIKASFEAIAEGARFILSRPIIYSTMVLDFIATFFSSANTLLPFVARDLLNVDAVGYGWLAAGQAIGSVGAGLVLAGRKDIRRQGAIILAAVILFGLATVLLGLSQWYMLAMAALILIGGSDTVSSILRNTIRQLNTPDNVRGRMVSINQVFFTGGPQLGEIRAGLAAQAFGPVYAIVSGGIATVIGVILVAARWPILRTYNGDEHDPQPAAAVTPAD